MSGPVITGTPYLPKQFDTSQTPKTSQSGKSATPKPSAGGRFRGPMRPISTLITTPLPSPPTSNSSAPKPLSSYTATPPNYNPNTPIHYHLSINQGVQEDLQLQTQL